MEFTVKLPTGSAIGRVVACLDGHLMPTVSAPPDAYGVKGSYFHEFMRAVGKDGPEVRDAALEAIPADDPARDLCTDLEVDKIPRGGHHEPAFAWNPDTGEARLLGENIQRAYEQHGADLTKEYVLSMDFAGVMQDRRGIVIDYKSGWQIVAAKDSWQLKDAAVQHAAVSGCDEIVAAHLIQRGDRPRWDIVEWGPMDLAGFREELRDLARRLRARGPQTYDTANVVEGDHCRYCPAFNRCPAKVGLVREMARAMDTSFVELRQVVSPENAAFVWRTLDQFDGIAKALRRQVEKLAEREPIDLDNGYVLRLAQGEPKDKVVDPRQALAYIGEAYDIEASLAAQSTNKTNIAAAMKGWARRTGRMTPSDAVDDAIKALRDRALIEKVCADEAVREVRKDRG